MKIAFFRYITLSMARQIFIFLFKYYFTSGILSKKEFMKEICPKNWSEYTGAVNVLCNIQTVKKRDEGNNWT